MVASRKPKSTKLIEKPEPNPGVVGVGGLLTDDFTVPVTIPKPPKQLTPKKSSKPSSFHTSKSHNSGNDPFSDEWKCESCKYSKKVTKICDNHSNICINCCITCWTCGGCLVRFRNNDMSFCDLCFRCDTCCECSYCDECNGKKWKKYFCDKCDFCKECCDCHEECKCECKSHPECCPHLGSKTQCKGLVPGWETRGETVHVRTTNLDTSQFSNFDPVTGMVDFYLLSFMEYDWCNNVESSIAGHEYQVALRVYCDMAKKEREKLVETLAPVFATYIDMAVGGEVRHHPSLQVTLSQDRFKAWKQWPSIREQVGPAALLDAADLFMELSSGYGGTKWATAAKVLYQLETGVIEPFIFVDRVFNLQHNNGSLLNKVGWKPYEGPLSTIMGSLPLMQVIGKAHAAIEPDLILLSLMASENVNSLLRDWWLSRNKVFYSLGKRPLLLPDWRKNVKYAYGEANKIWTPTVGMMYLNESWVKKHIPKKSPKPKKPSKKAPIIDIDDLVHKYNKGDINYSEFIHQYNAKPDYTKFLINKVDV